MYGADGRTVRLPTRKSRALLAYLADHPGRRFTRDHLGALLWGDQPDAQARQSLRQALSTLRQAAGAGVIMADTDYVCCPADSVESDVNDFESFRRLDTLDAADQAERIYAGEFLDRFELGQPGFDEWRDAERTPLKEISRRNLDTSSSDAATTPTLAVPSRQRTCRPSMIRSTKMFTAP
jgi:DNA-binding SARP family transcriptional activator